MKPILKLYRGYANKQELIVMGHVFKPTTKLDYDFQKKNFKNATSIIKMFQVPTHSNSSIYLEINGEKINALVVAGIILDNLDLVNYCSNKI